MVNIDSIVMDRDDSSCASLPSDPSRDDSLPSKVSTTDESDEEGSSSRHGSEKWLPQTDHTRKAVHAMMMLNNGFKPKKIISILFPNDRSSTNPFLSEEAAFKYLQDLIEQPPKRIKLHQYNTFQDAVELFRTSKRILMLTGAGVSVSCGIPDFRSKDGIYARLHESFPDLPEPSAMFDINYFRRNPKPFYDFAKEIFPGMFEPSFSHKLIAHLEKKDKLLRNYTQNIDTLEKVAGIERVIECHGSFSSATCLNCKAIYQPDDIRENVMEKKVAYCKECKEGVIKPDIVFFGEDLHADFHTQMSIDKDQADLVVVIGSSLKVRPVALIPFAVSPDVPQILINREPIPHYTSDIELLGNCDDILREIALEMGEGEFVKDYDEKHGKEERKRKTMIPREEFDRLINKIDEEQKVEMGGEEDGEEKKGEEEEEKNGEKEEEEEKNGEKEEEEEKNGEKEEEEENAEKTEENGTNANSDAETEESKKENEEGDEEDGEPAPKRRRMESSNSLSALYARKFVNVETLLSDADTFIQASVNQFVFHGAEIYMDMDSRVLSQRPRVRCASTTDCSEDDDHDHGDLLYEEESLPNSPRSEPFRPPSILVQPSDRFQRSSSCNPSLDTNSLVPSELIRSALNPYDFEDELSSP